MCSSLCRLSSGSQFCLGGQSHSGAGITISRLGGHGFCRRRMTDGNCGRADRDFNRMAESSPLSLSTLSGQTPDSIRRRELDSDGHTDAMSRNTSFMISLMDICNKMILPLAALQQDCATCASADTAVVSASTEFDSDPVNTPDDAAAAAASLSQLASNGDTAGGGGGGGPCHCRCRPTEAAAAADAAAAKKKAANGRPQLPSMALHQQTNTNQHQPTDHCCGRDGGGGGWQKNANASTARQSQSQKPPPRPSPPPTRPSKETIASKETIVSNADISLCVLDDAALAAAELRPLLKRHDVPFWNAAEFQDFRASAPAPTQLQEPMLDTGRHRHMIILDSHYRLKATIAGFRAPVYRPY